MKSLTKKTLIIALILSTIIAHTACGKKNNDGGSAKPLKEPVSGEGYYLDTVCSIKVYAVDANSKEDPEDVINGAFDTVSQYEKLLSKTVPGSDVDRINKAGAEGAECDERTVALIEKAIEYSEISKGRFDITIGRVSDLWDFHAEAPVLPDKKKLDEAIKHVDYRNLKIEGNKVMLEDPESQVDLGAIAKGYIADQAADYLRNHGIKGAIVDLGGNISVVGSKDGNSESFKVGVKKPFSKTGELICILPARDKNVVTSGTYERYIEVGGKRYHHILSVKDGFPVKTDLISVTVVGEKGKGADCDALATVCMIMGKKQAKDLIESMPGYEALFLSSDDSITKTSGFKME
jgi:thiamine biosynthesis lipoprotein